MRQLFALKLTVALLVMLTCITLTAFFNELHATRRPSSHPSFPVLPLQSLEPPRIPPPIQTSGDKRACATPDKFQMTWNVSDMIALIASSSRTHLQRRATPRKLIYGMLFDCEEEMLEIKLNELGHVVDHFIIVEGQYSLQNRIRTQCLPDLLKSNEHLSRWSHKIVYVYDSEPVQHFQYWEAEVYYRNLIGIKGLQRLDTAGDDLVIVTDVDELPSANFLWVLKHYEGFATAINMGLLWTYYSFKWVNPKAWPVNAILSVRELSQVNNQTNRIRFDMAGQSSWTTGDAVVGWHCSWCMPVARYLDKMAHFAHSELNQAKFSNIAWLNSMRAQGLWFPDSAPNACIQTQMQVPGYVQANMSRFETICT